MATNQLTTSSSNNGTQTTTAAPQESVAANSVSGGTPSSIQPGNDANSLNNASTTIGIPLKAGNLTTLNVGSATSSTAVAVQPQQHKINTGLLGLSVLLFVAAIALFWFTGRDAKKTTIKR